MPHAYPRANRQPLPQGLVAGWVGTTQAQLSRIEHGPAILHLDRLIHWATVLRVPETYLWSHVGPLAPRRTVQAGDQSNGQQPSAADHAGMGLGEDADVRRRRAPELVSLGLMGGTSAVALEALRHDLIREPSTAAATRAIGPA